MGGGRDSARFSRLAVVGTGEKQCGVWRPCIQEMGVSKNEVYGMPIK